MQVNKSDYINTININAIKSSIYKNIKYIEMITVTVLHIIKYARIA